MALLCVGRRLGLIFRNKKDEKEIQLQFPVCDMTYDIRGQYLLFTGNSTILWKYKVSRHKFSEVMTPYSGLQKCTAYHGPSDKILLSTERFVVEYYHHRKTQSEIYRFRDDLAKHLKSDVNPRVTSLTYVNSNAAIGLSSGQVLLYDRRYSSAPYFVYENHCNEIRKSKIVISGDQKYLMTLDREIVNVFDFRTGLTLESFICHRSIAGDERFTDVCHLSDTGLFCFVGNRPKIVSYYSSDIGPLPGFCKDDVLWKEEDMPSAAAEVQPMMYNHAASGTVTAHRIKMGSADVSADVDISDNSTSSDDVDNDSTASGDYDDC